MSYVELFTDKNLLKQIPKQPGVYKIFSVQDELLYVGKAKDLRNRLSNYLRNNLDLYKQRMIQEAYAVEFIVTKTQEEALLLESNLIKDNRPPYNIIFRDDKSYPYLRISYSEKFPRLLVSRRVKNKNDFYFGPFPNAESLRMLIKVLKSTFPIIQKEDLTCQKENQTPCIYYQMKRCNAPCAGYIKRQAYLSIIDEIKDLFAKNHGLLKQKVIDQMHKYAYNEQFEKAIELRDAINAINILKENPIVVDVKIDFVDCFAFYTHNDITSVYVLNIRLGKVLSGKSFFFDFKCDKDFKEEFIVQYYLQGELIPDKIFTDEQLEISLEVFNKKVEVIYPKRAGGVKLIGMAMANAKEQWTIHSSKITANLEIFSAIKNILRLNKLPYYFDVVDIAHIDFEDVVAGVVRFDISGFNKSYYRRYKLTTKFESEAMKEAISRHLNLIKNTNLNEPDVFVLDGGLIQVRAAAEFNVKAIGIAKEKENNYSIRSKGDVNDSVYTLDGKIEVDKKLLNFLQKLRDEAHRFANTYHRNLRKTHTLASILDRVEYIGPKRKRSLFEKFGNIENIKLASMDELTSIKGITPKIAQYIKEKLDEYNAL